VASRPEHGQDANGAPLEGDHTCIFCGGASARVVCNQPDLRYFPDEVFSVLECSACGTKFTAPRFSENDLNKYYPSAYGAYTPREQVLATFSGPPPTTAMGVDYCRRLRSELAEAGAPALFSRVRNAASRWRMSLNLLKCTETYPYALPLKADGTKVLYLGSGSPSRFRGYLALPGVSLQTIDINEEMCDAYRQVGINAHCGFISSAEFDDSSFDVVFSSMVLEHLLDPRQELKQLSRWLSEDGIMVCAIPDMGSVEWRTKPVFYDLPRHRTFFDDATARMFFDDAGLRVLKRMHPPFGHGFAQSRFVRGSNRAGFDPASFAEPATSWMQVVSWLLSRVGQSGYVVYYLGRKR